MADSVLSVDGIRRRKSAQSDLGRPTWGRDSKTAGLRRLRHQPPMPSAEAEPEQAECGARRVAEDSTAKYQAVRAG